MIDWHSHLLPAMDDGSKDVEESLTLLNLLHEQGVSHVVATPHFYANDESVDRFLLRRKQSFDNLKGNISNQCPEIHLGAEVKYYQGISRMEGLDKLCIEGSDILLLEMPFTKWPNFVVNELLELASMARFKIMLAHIERYFAFQNKSVWKNLYETGILMQVNASVFFRMSTRRQIVKFIKAGGVLFLGSDCHNLSSRPPRMGDAFSILKKRLGESCLFQIQRCWNLTLHRNNS